MIIKITRSSGKPFPEHQPIKVDYYIAFGLKTDFLIYEIDLYEPLNIQTSEEVAFALKTDDGSATNFLAVLYDIVTLDKRTHVQLHFVSKYAKKLFSSAPLYGKGKTTEIASAIYKQAGISTVYAEEHSTTALQNILFPRTATRIEAIQYLLNRSAVPDGLLMSTIVGDKAYIRNVKKGKNNLKSMPYSVVSIEDRRKKVDFAGGLRMETFSDSADVNSFISTKKGTAETPLALFNTVDSVEVSRALAKVRQARAYYNNYTAVLRMLFWVPLLGSNIIADASDLHEKTAIPYLDAGTYYVSAQILTVDFAKNTESTLCRVQLVA